MQGTARLLATFFGLLLLARAAGAADIQALGQETQRVDISKEQISLVWWIPTQFWEELASNYAPPAMPEAARTRITEVLSDLTIVALMRGRLTAAGITESQPLQELLQNTTFEVNGKRVEPLAPDQVPEAAAMLLAGIRPALVQSIGPFGEKLEVAIFPGKLDGKPLIDAKQPGQVITTFYGTKYGVRLPLISLLPPRFDRRTGAKFPGDYLYNPYTGKKLDSY